MPKAKLPCMLVHNKKNAGRNNFILLNIFSSEIQYSRTENINQLIICALTPKKGKRIEVTKISGKKEKGKILFKLNSINGMKKYLE